MKEIMLTKRSDGSGNLYAIFGEDCRGLKGV